MKCNEGGKPNRLVDETSPYLLQHAYNPVDWYPWGEEALGKAREEDKPILLSIGYSACHWCHVMEHESFENEAVARLMNEHFVNIKVDREERPDVDAIYMNFVQMTTGSGGWPLTVFLTPELVPFFGGTYFPPGDHFGRPGFRRVLERVADVYRNRRDELNAGSREIVERLRQTARFETQPGAVSEDLPSEAYDRLSKQFDTAHGGFGGAPKFPASMSLGFLLRWYRRSVNRNALEMVEKSLQEMARGGLYDQLGGGFHRYCVDAAWIVPHFEKMLYDNALLGRLYLEAYQVTGSQEYRRVVEGTLDWVIREMSDSEGGFYSALDADSEGEEGKFYVWTPVEVDAVLEEEEARIFKDFFDVTGSGNFEGINVLRRRYDLNAYSRSLSLDPQDLLSRLEASRKRLLAARETRTRPALDDKVLAAWNGLMLTAFAEGGFVLDRPDYLERARKNAQFLYSSMLKDSRLHRSWRKGEARLGGYLEDYALVIEGWLTLFQVTGEQEWLKRSQELMEIQLDLFWDEEARDFYFTARDHEKLLVRQKEHMDNATPSGNSVSCFNLLRLAELTGQAAYRERAAGMLERMGPSTSRFPTAFGYWLQALDFFLGPVYQICLVGPTAQRNILAGPVRETFLPNKVLVLADPGREGDGDAVPLLKGRGAVDGKATAYVCREFTCRRPVTSGEELRNQLDS